MILFIFFRFFYSDQVKDKKNPILFPDFLNCEGSLYLHSDRKCIELQPLIVTEIWSHSAEKCKYGIHGASGKTLWWKMQAYFMKINWQN